MAKRLTDCGKWDKVWFRKLSPVYKCLWIYICDRCDHSGIWEVDFEMAGMYIGAAIDQEEAKAVLSKQFLVLNGGSRWLIKDFLVFQYGRMSEGNKMFNTIQTSLEKNGLKMGDIWGIDGGTVTVKDTVKVKDKVKDKDITDEQFIESLKNNPAYSGLDIDTELGKMDAWILANPARKKTRRFIVSWLNKADKPVHTGVHRPHLTKQQQSNLLQLEQLNRELVNDKRCV